MGDSRSFKSGVVIAIATGAFLAGCVGGCTFGVLTSNDSPSTPSTQSTPTPASDTDAQNRILFSQLLGHPAFDDVDPSSLITKARQICDRLDDESGSRQVKGEVLGKLVGAGFDMDNAITFMAAAVTAYCPQHLAAIR